MNRSFWAFVAALCVSGALPALSRARQPCVPRLSDEFADGYLAGKFRTLLVRDTPAGPELWAGGQNIFSIGVSGVLSAARWDGREWTAAIGQLPGSVGTSSTTIWSFATFDGSGPALFALGNFRSFQGVPTCGVAAWNGMSWRGYGQGSTGSGTVTCAAFFDDGSGPALYIGGTFTQIGTIGCSGFACWRAGTWSAPPHPAGGVAALAAFDDGTGPALYAAGEFHPVATSSASCAVARWDGRSWEYLGGVIRGFSGGLALAVFDDGSGPGLWLGGAFEALGDTRTARLAKWIACPAGVCYANCDTSAGRGGGPTLSASDFLCFQQRFAAGQPYANCDGSTDPFGAPTLNVADFVCFMRRFAAGCP
jgi:hypothetical protein